MGQYLDILLQGFKLCVQARLTCTFRNLLLQLFQLLLLPHLVRNLYVLPLLIKPEVPSSTLFRGPLKTFICDGRRGPRRIWIRSVRRCLGDRGHRWRCGSIPGVGLAVLIRALDCEQVDHSPTLIEANLGCIGLYLSFLDCGAGIDVSKSSGCAAIFKPTPC